MNETITKNNEVVEDTFEEIKVEKPYKFRKLSSDDMFIMFAILKKIGIKEFKQCFEGEALKSIKSAFSNAGDDVKAREKAVASIGVTVFFDIADVILGNLPKCREEIYTLLSQVSGMDVDAIREDALLFTEMLIDFFKKPEFPGFFKVVSKLFK